MKKSLFLLTVFSLLFTFTQQAQESQKTGKVKIKYSFANIVEGYDHTTKTTVLVDGVQVAESNQHKESQPTEIEFSIPVGKHDIEIVNYAFYDGKWEVHSIEKVQIRIGTKTSMNCLKKNLELNCICKTFFDDYSECLVLYFD